MNLRQIEVFRAVMNTGSFTRAAEVLHVAQPGISRMMRHLELQLEVALFERIHGKVVATPEAHALHVEVERAYRGVETVQSFARQLRGGAKTVLRIVSSPNVGLEIVPGALVELSRRYLSARLSLGIQQRAAQMTEQLITEQADIGISALELEHPLLESRPLGQWKLVCVMREDHPLSARREIQVKDVEHERLVAFHKDTMQGGIIGQWFSRMGVEPVSSIEVRSGQAACSLVAQGGGIAFVDNVTATALAPLGLVHRPVRASPRLGIHAIVNKERPPPMLAKPLCEMITARLRAG